MNSGDRIKIEREGGGRAPHKGILLFDVVEGRRLWMELDVEERPNKSFKTSTVVRILPGNRIVTQNSVYQITYL